MPQMRRPAEWARGPVCAQVHACASATATSEGIARQVGRLWLRTPASVVRDADGRALTMARETEEEWNKARPRRSLFDMDQKALVLRSPAAR